MRTAQERPFYQAVLVFVISITLAFALLLCFIWSWIGTRDRPLQTCLLVMLATLLVLGILQRETTAYLARTTGTLAYHGLTEEWLGRTEFHSVCQRFFNDGSIRHWQVTGHPWPKEPVLYLVNYPSESLEYFHFGMLPPSQTAPVAVLAAAPLKRPGLQQRFLRVVFREGENYLECKRGGGFERTKRQVEKAVFSNHHSVWAYPEREAVARGNGEIGEFRSGLFCIAYQLHIPIVPLVIGYLRTDAAARQPQQIPCVVGRPIPPGTRPRRAQHRCYRWMRKTLRKVLFTQSR